MGVGECKCWDAQLWRQRTGRLGGKGSQGKIIKVGKTLPCKLCPAQKVVVENRLLNALLYKTSQVVLFSPEPLLLLWWEGTYSPLDQCPYFTNGESEAQRRKVISPKSHAELVVEPKLT